MKCKKKYNDGGQVPNEDDPKKKKRYRGGKSSDASVDFNVTRGRKSTMGSCEDGDLRACKTKVVKKKKFNPSKGVLSKGRIVKSKPEEEKKPTPNSTGKFSNPRFL
jgi:hypothetical protein